MICKFCLKYCWQRYSDIWVWEMRLIMLIGNRWTHKLFYNELHIELFCSMTGPGRLSTRSGPWPGRVGYTPGLVHDWAGSAIHQVTTSNGPSVNQVNAVWDFDTVLLKLYLSFLKKKNLFLRDCMHIFQFVSKGLYAHFPICF